MNWFYYTKKLDEMIFHQDDVSIHNVYYEDLKIVSITIIQNINNNTVASTPYNTADSVIPY